MSWKKSKFPSPYGVIFILIIILLIIVTIWIVIVSVSLRSYIHSYENVFELTEDIVESYSGFRLLTELYSFLLRKVVYLSKRMGVSVSLRSYIHSYTRLVRVYYIKERTCFRLLTELYSFLSILRHDYNNGFVSMFPSPYGVIFILILSPTIICLFVYSQFPSPYGVIFILMIN